MTDLALDIAKSASGAHAAMALFQGHLKVFQAACECGDWVTAEDSRAKALASLDAYCDHIAAMHKRLESK